MNSLNKLTWSEARDLIRSWRDGNERKSQDLVQLWKSVIETNLNKFGNEKFLVLEQVCVASLDCYNLSIAENCIKLLKKEFPNSLRVNKYSVMLLEAEERYDEALKLLDALIKVDETNSALRKRRVAIYKAQAKYIEAIKELSDYLKTFMADAEAWQELSDLYILEHDYNKAAFCIEELILYNPHNHLLHQRYADIRYTQGGFENIELARSYYCQSLRLNPNNVRALYGVYLASSYITTSSKCTAQKKKESVKLTEWALSQIKKRYEEHSNNADLEERLSALSIS